MSAIHHSFALLPHILPHYHYHPRPPSKGYKGNNVETTSSSPLLISKLLPPTPNESLAGKGGTGTPSNEVFFLLSLLLQQDPATAIVII